MKAFEEAVIDALQESGVVSDVEEAAAWVVGTVDDRGMHVVSRPPKSRVVKRAGLLEHKFSKAQKIYLLSLLKNGVSDGTVQTFSALQALGCVEKDPHVKLTREGIAVATFLNLEQ